MDSFTGPKGTVFHHHSDMSGDVIIDVIRHKDNGSETTEVHIPGADILALAAEYLRLGAISRLEQLTTAEIFNKALSL